MVNVNAGNVTVTSDNVIFAINIEEKNAPDIILENEMEFVGPDTFFVSDDTIILDDTVNHRLLVYSTENFIKEIKLNWFEDVKMMFYDGVDEIKIVYENLNEVNFTEYCLTTISLKTGEKTSNDILSDYDRILLEYSFDESGQLLTYYCNEENADDTLVKNYSLGEEKDSGFIRNSDKVLGTFNDNEYSIHKVYSKSDNSIYLQRYLLIKSENSYSCMGINDSIGRIDRGAFQVLSSGVVYQMVLSEEEITIVELVDSAMNDLARTNMEKQELYSIPTEKAITYASSYQTISTTEVRERMETYRNINWTFNSTRNAELEVTGNSSLVTQPSWLADISDGSDHSVYGVPYCWGGWNAETFVTHINNGKYAGNVCLSAESQVSGTVGMDCSGYVSVAFDLPYKHGTAALYNCFTVVDDYTDVEYCDIINKANGHAVIVISSYVSNGTKYVNIYEESNTAGKIRVRTGMDLESYYIDSGFNLMRYDYLE